MNQPGIVIGGAKAWKVLRYRTLGVAFHWFGRDHEPTMFLFPMHAELMAKRVIPWGLPLPAAHELVLPETKGDGVDTRTLMAKATRAVTVMGLDPNSYSDVHMVADCILHHLDQLVRMPPAPDWLMRGENPPPVGEAALIVDGKTVAESAL